MDWSRMTNSTSPHTFIEGSDKNKEFISKSLEKNPYAMFIRKISKEFPDNILEPYVVDIKPIHLTNRTNEIIFGFFTIGLFGFISYRFKTLYFH
jgi:hypothetical protein